MDAAWRIDRGWFGPGMSRSPDTCPLRVLSPIDQFHIHSFQLVLTQHRQDGGELASAYPLAIAERRTQFGFEVLPTSED